jgi:osmotically-inducible protein OsmY
LIRRLFALVVLLAFTAAGLYYWKTRSGGPDLPGLPRKVAHLQTNLKDAAVTTAVLAAFNLNRSTSRYELRANTQRGVVTLTGEVPDEATRAAAARVAAAVPEVASVENRIRIGARPPAERSLIESLDDEKLELQVKAALSLNRTLRDLPLKTRAYRGVVTLSGDVATDAQRTLALEVARDTAGVSQVTDAIRVGGHDAAPTR